MVTARASRRRARTRRCTRVSGSGCASGMSSAVRFDAWIAAMRAMPSTSPFFVSPAADRRRACAGCMTMRPPARATRLGDILAADVDHVRLPGGVEVGKMSAGCAAGASPRRAARPRRGDGGALRVARYAPSRSRIELETGSGILAPAISRPSATVPVAARRVAMAPSLLRRRATARSPARRGNGLRARARAGRARRARACPTSATPSQAPLSPAQERKLGEAIIQQLRSSGGYMNDPEVNDYLNELGHRLVNASRDAKQDFEFFAVPDPRSTRSRCPAATSACNTGLILLTQIESELAARARARDHARHAASHRAHDQRAEGLDADDAGRPRARACSPRAPAATASGDIAQGAIAASQALAIQNQLNFTRENEYEADRIGFQRLDAAGFDVYGDGHVHGAHAARGALRRRQRAQLPAHAPDHLRAHRRSAVARAGPPVPAGHRLARLPPRARAAAQLPGRRRARPSRISTTRSPSASTTTRSPRTTASSRRCCARRHSARAQGELAKLEKIAPPHPMIEAMAGHVLLDSGDLKGAIARFEAALARYPGKMQLVYDYPEALIQAGRFADAAAFAEQQLAALPVATARCTSSPRAPTASSTSSSAASPPGRVLRLAGQPQGRDRPVRARGQGEGRRLLPVVGGRHAVARAAARGERPGQDARQGRLGPKRRFMPPGVRRRVAPPAVAGAHARGGRAAPATSSRQGARTTRTPPSLLASQPRHPAGAAADE